MQKAAGGFLLQLHEQGDEYLISFYSSGSHLHRKTNWPVIANYCILSIFCNAFRAIQKRVTSRCQRTTRFWYNPFPTIKAQLVGGSLDRYPPTVSGFFSHNGAWKGSIIRPSKMPQSLFMAPITNNLNVKALVVALPVDFKNNFWGNSTSGGIYIYFEIELRRQRFKDAKSSAFHSLRDSGRHCTVLRTS